MTSHQTVLEELGQCNALLQNGLIEQHDLDDACKSLLQRLLSSNSISLADKQETIIAAKQYGISQAVLLEAGKQLLQLRVDQCRVDSGTSEDPASPAEQPGPSSMQQDGPAADTSPQQSDASTPVSDFRDYGYEDSYDGTSMSGSDVGSDGDYEAELLCQVWLGDPSWLGGACQMTDEEEYDREALQALGLADSAEADQAEAMAEDAPGQTAAEAAAATAAAEAAAGTPGVQAPQDSVPAKQDILQAIAAAAADAQQEEAEVQAAAKADDDDTTRVRAAE